MQCIVGKCSKAFHVSCAREQKSGASYEELEVEEHEVLVNLDTASGSATSDANGAPMTVDGSARRVLKTITKLNVAITCAQHNKVLWTHLSRRITNWSIESQPSEA